MRLALAAAAIALAAAVAPAAANDSSVTIGIGGLVLTKNSDIAMRAEDLTISPAHVHVRYVFVNESGRDLDEIIAFPLPDIDAGAIWEAPMGTMGDDPVNFVGFKASADGKPIHVSVEQRAMVKGRDVTAAVKAAGLPVNVLAGNGHVLVDSLPPARRAALAKEGIVVTSGDYIRPNWTIVTKFYWRQHFPPGTPVVITHDYTPITGSTFFMEGDAEAAGPNSQYVGPYCMDASTRAFARKRARQGSTRMPRTETTKGMLMADTTDYILTTANNWKGPVGRFHLTLDKLKPTNVLSLCWDGDLKKTGPTTFEAVRKNFAPKHDIHLLVLE